MPKKFAAENKDVFSPKCVLHRQSHSCMSHPDIVTRIPATFRCFVATWALSALIFANSCSMGGRSRRFIHIHGQLIPIHGRPIHLHGQRPFRISGRWIFQQRARLEGWCWRELALQGLPVVANSYLAVHAILAVSDQSYDSHSSPPCFCRLP